ncbi:Ankyrin repeat isoform B [Micractinium conductrix]|uniref:Ankyrin repeat isoform B n=1 Tax=Micractinium conductrix TaxID=554055 RepID=A0A2P6V3D0_9CHLO|nr:Ankyrin repeat isoform B [Micractinium conductrix]|eukprot:PSC68603.1 Ankyrin repeat isoform B [Micractinium conductrix]
MVRLKQTARKSTGIHVPGPLESLWHPALTEAMEQGTPGALAAAASAQSYRPEPDLQYLVEQQFELRHSLCEQPEQLVQRSPFLPESAFGMAPYAAFHGHLPALEFCLQRGAGLEYTGQRDGAMTRRLLKAGAMLDNPFLLDCLPPAWGSLLASKAGTWSTDAHLPCYPPAFHDAAAELLRITYKHGMSWQGGRLARWNGWTSGLQTDEGAGPSRPCGSGDSSNEDGEEEGGSESD